MVEAEGVLRDKGNAPFAHGTHVLETTGIEFYVVHSDNVHLAAYVGHFVYVRGVLLGIGQDQGGPEYLHVTYVWCQGQ